MWPRLTVEFPALATSLSHLPLALFGHHFQTAVLLLGCAWNIYYHFLWFCQRNALRLAVKWPLLILWVHNRDENAGEALRVCLGSCACSWSTVSHWRVVGDPCLNGLRPSLPWVSETEGSWRKKVSRPSCEFSEEVELTGTMWDDASIEMRLKRGGAKLIWRWQDVIREWNNAMLGPLGGSHYSWRWGKRACRHTLLAAAGPTGDTVYTWL